MKGGHVPGFRDVYLDRPAKSVSNYHLTVRRNLMRGSAVLPINRLLTIETYPAPSAALIPVISQDALPST